MRYRALCGAAVAAAAMLDLSGCATACTANVDKLASLQRGMSYQEATRIMGCPGRPVAREGSDPGVQSIEWEGPGPNLFMSTELDFLDDKLLYYTTRSRSGF
jgi:hypothetical protein